jgi:hypothetical protein
VVAGLWIVALCSLWQPVAWFAEQVAIATSGEPPAFQGPLLAVAQALLLALPAGVSLFVARGGLPRAAALAWLLACGALALLGLARALPISATQPVALVQSAVCWLLVAVLRWTLGRSNVGRAGANAGSSLVLAPAALAGAVVVGMPWLVGGALGSWLDTLLALLHGLSLGALASSIVCAALLPALDQPRGGLALLAGLAAGVALMPLASAAGVGGSPLLLLAALPALGLGVAALAALAAFDRRRAWLPIALLVGVSAAFPLALIDPDELSLLLGAGDIPGVVMRAAPLAFIAALLVSAGLWAPARWPGILRPPAVALGALGAALVAAGLVYALGGHPGFYGERLFVILRDQADVSQAASIPNRDERLRSVYAMLTGHANTSQAGLRASLDQLGVAYTPYYLVNALEVDGGPLLRLYIQTRPEVDRVLDSPRLRPLPGPPPSDAEADQSAPSSPEWNIAGIGAERVWRELGVRGEGIVLGESDSGVDGAHPALRDGYRGRGGQDDYNWLDPWSGTAAPTDFGGHGTHTTGSAVGRNNVGVAPGAEWIGCVNLQRNLGNPALYLDCMQFMLAPYPQRGDPFTDGAPGQAPHVLNNSWGCPPLEGCDAASLAPAVAALRAAGIFVVASAGNEGPGCSSVADPIAIYDAAFSVGAIDQAGDVTEFSSRGPVEADGSGRPKPDIVAPGAEILSALPGGGYGRLDGTSMAGPHVAGVVALMWSANPALIGDIDRTEQILIETATPYEGTAPIGCASAEGEVSNAYGYGVVDAYAAVQAALAAR